MSIRLAFIFLMTMLLGRVGDVVAQPTPPPAVPEFVYRADTRTPNEVRRSGGFVARGVDASRPGVVADLSLYSHATGHAGPQNDYSGYVSTSSDFMRAYRWLWDQLSVFRTGYVYTIRPTALFLDVNGSLGRYLDPIIRQENEWAAMGRIHWYQVVGWRSVAAPPDMPMTPNPQYNPNHIAFATPPIGAAPQMAHFPLGHAAWNEMPWMQFTDCGPPTANRKKRTSADANCTPFENGNMDYSYYSGYLSSLAATQCGGPCLEGDRSEDQDAQYAKTLTLLRDSDVGKKRSCTNGVDEIPESIAEMYKNTLCPQMRVDDKMRVRGGYLLKSADSSCMIIETPDDTYTTGEICEPTRTMVFEKFGEIPDCGKDNLLISSRDVEVDASICFTMIQGNELVRLAGEDVVTGGSTKPCTTAKNTNLMESALCKNIARTTPPIVVSSESPGGSQCWEGYSPVTVQQALANVNMLCQVGSYAPSVAQQIGLADGYFDEATCKVWDILPEKPLTYTFCSVGVEGSTPYLSTMELVTTGQTCPAGFELATEADVEADPSVCFGALPRGAAARLANSASLNMSTYDAPTTPLCKTHPSDQRALTMAVCKAVAQ